MPASRQLEGGTSQAHLPRHGEAESSVAWQGRAYLRACEAPVQRRMVGGNGNAAPMAGRHAAAARDADAGQPHLSHSIAIRPTWERLKRCAAD